MEQRWCSPGSVGGDLVIAQRPTIAGAVYIYNYRSFRGSRKAKMQTTHLIRLLILVALSGWPMRITSARLVHEQMPKDPCWFMALKNGSFTSEMLEKRNNREMYGYPTEIPLTEAIRIFNEETQCKALYKDYPPLTEEELIAAIVAGADYGKQGKIWLAQRDALWKIAARKVMPKGALLVVDSGGRVQESPLRPRGTIQSKGITITLFLGLETSAHGHIARPEQTLIVRKTYSKIEIVK